MGKHTDLVDDILFNYDDVSSTIRQTLKENEKKLSLCLSYKENANKEVLYRYGLREEKELSEFLRANKDFDALVDKISKKYIDVFETITTDESLLTTEIQKDSYDAYNLHQEHTQNISDLKDIAYQRFIKLVEASDQKIDEEMRVHHQFIESENERFVQTQKNYQTKHSNLSNQLLWSIEQSKNALEKLKEELNTNADNQVSFMNDTIFNTISILRQTKSEISDKFKEATTIYNQEMSRIQSLNQQRQKPHSLINQTLIHQYVKQIREVNQKKIHFENMILKELSISKKSIGNRIVAMDELGNTEKVERYIMQYDIIQKKADYLLKRNESMSKLLISKYQNEIKKIKIDSFKRVEEIKLAYYMPNMYFQNSINLYSNFSFYVNESFDELDNLLSDLILFNRDYKQALLEYVTLDSKTLEEYKVSLMVRITKVCSDLTDFLSNIDRNSKELVTLESKSQLQIANIRKQIENLEIQGDYDKHVKSIEFDSYFVDRQYEINSAKIQAKKEKNEKYLQIQREIAYARQTHELYLCQSGYAKNFSELEQNSRLRNYEKQYELVKAAYPHMLNQLHLEYDIKKNQTNLSHLREINLLADRYREEERAFQKNQEKGSEEVVDFVHKTQKILDLNQTHTSAYIHELQNMQEKHSYAKILEHSRNEVISHYEQQYKSKIFMNEQATYLIHHEFYLLNELLSSAFDDIEQSMKSWLMILEPDTQSVFLPKLTKENFYYYQVLSLTESLLTNIHRTLVQFNELAAYPEFEEALVAFSEDYVIRAHALMNQLEHAKAKKSLILTQDFLTETILKAREVKEKVTLMLDPIEKAILRDDVIFIEKAKQRKNKVLNQINIEYDHLIYHAAKQDKKRQTQTKQLIQSAKEIDDVFKKQVSNINKIYENSLTDERAELNYIKESIGSLISEMNRKNEKQLQLLEKSKKQDVEFEKQRLDAFEKATKKLQSVIHDVHLSEVKYIDAQVDKKTKELNDSLALLDTQIAKIPDTYNTTLVSLDQTKYDEFQLKRKDLLSEYKAIEDNKFTGRPALLEKIQAVKDSLPNEYVDIYQTIAKSEDQYLNNFVNISNDYEHDFLEFLESQASTRYEVKYQETMDRPFLRFEELGEKLTKKNKDAYEETVVKSNNMKQTIAKEHERFNQLQDRIVND